MVITYYLDNVNFTSNNKNQWNLNFFQVKINVLVENTNFM